MSDEHPMARLALSMYVGEWYCYCGHEYATLDDLLARDPVWVYDKAKDPPIRGKGQLLACAACYAARQETPTP